MKAAFEECTTPAFRYNIDFNLSLQLIIEIVYYEVIMDYIADAPNQN